MITAVASNVLFDLLIPQAPDAQTLRRSFIEAEEEGSVVVSEAVYAEIAAEFQDGPGVEAFLSRVHIELLPITGESRFYAGAAWREHAARRPRAMVCPACGGQQTVNCSSCGADLRPRQHVLADFLIGAHAAPGPTAC